MNNKKISINPVVIVSIFIIVIFIILLIVSLKDVFRDNPYGESIKIDNLIEYYDNLSRDEQDLISNALYDMVLYNSLDDNTIPKDGALVRDNSAEYEYDNKLNLYKGSFIVDISSIEQSYRVKFRWSPNDNVSVGGYPVMVSCIPKNLQIYKNDNYVCSDIIKKTIDWANSYQLDYTFGLNTSYKVREIISSYLMSENDAEEYRAEVNAKSLIQEKSQFDLLFSFIVNLNKIQDYKISVGMDETYGNDYIVVFISGNEGDVGYIVANDSSSINKLTKMMRDYVGDPSFQVEIVDSE